MPRARFKENPIISFDFALILDIFAALAEKTENQFFTAFCESYTLIKKKIKFSSYIRKYKEMEQLHRHIWWLTASSYTVWLYKCSTLYFLIYEENLIYFFISVYIKKIIGRVHFGLIGLVFYTNVPQTGFFLRILNCRCRQVFNATIFMWYLYINKEQKNVLESSATTGKMTQNFE